MVNKVSSIASDKYKLLFDVPQGSVLKLTPLSLYTSHLSRVISMHKFIMFHIYADDTQLYIHFAKGNTDAAFEKLNNCVKDVKCWMSDNKLKLNPDATQLNLKTTYLKTTSHHFCVVS